MADIEINPLLTSADRHAFLNFSWSIYKNDPLRVPALLPEWRDRIDPNIGVFFRQGVADFFIARRGGVVVGTICAAEDCRANAERGQKECVFGFFNFIQDEGVFAALLETVIAWAQARGLDTITGPYQLDFEDSYGVLVEGRDRPPMHSRPSIVITHSPRQALDSLEECQVSAEVVRGSGFVASQVDANIADLVA
jgi:hypothetical protein